MALEAGMRCLDCNLPYWCYLLLGCGTLFPWNALITAADYWEQRFPGKHVDRLMTVSYLSVNLVVIAAFVKWHARVRPRLRIMSGLLGFTAAISAVPLLDLAPASSGTLAVLLLLVAICGLCDGVAQGALFGEAAALPPKFTQALIAGTAVSGVTVSLLRIITKATLPDTEDGLRRSSNVYFSIAALVCAACTAVYGYVLPHLPAMQRYRHEALERALHAEDGAAEDAQPSSDGKPAAGGSPRRQRLGGREQGQHAPLRTSIDLELSSEDHVHWERLRDRQLGGEDADGGQGGRQADEADGRALLGPAGDEQEEQRGSSASEWLRDSWQHGSGGGGVSSASLGAQAGAGVDVRTVFRLVWRLALANVLIYSITLSIFPGVLAEDVHSQELGSWYPVWLLAAFNMADCAGKSTPGLPALRLRNANVILCATMLRLLFVPAFHLAAVGGAGPAVIGCLTVLLGGSNGYLTACAMVEAPALVPPVAVELAGNLMVLSLIGGLTLGAACGFLWIL